MSQEVEGGEALWALVVIVRTVAFPLREVRSRWKVLSRESHFYFNRPFGVLCRKWTVGG